MFYKDKCNSICKVDKIPIDDIFDINALAQDYGPLYNIEQKKDETNDAYRNRLAGELRQQGYIIEAHEVSSGRRYDDPAQGLAGPMAGIIGAVAQAIQGKDHSPNNPERQIGDDIAVGVVVRKGKDKTESAIESIFGSLGVEAGMDLIDGMYKNKK